MMSVMIPDTLEEQFGGPTIYELYLAICGDGVNHTRGVFFCPIFFFHLRFGHDS